MYSRCYRSSRMENKIFQIVSNSLGATRELCHKQNNLSLKHSSLNIQARVTLGTSEGLEVVVNVGR